MPNSEMHRILGELLQEAAEDLVGLWVLQKWVQRASGAEPGASAVRADTLAIVDAAIASGMVVAGSFAGTDFHLWQLDHAGVRRRIESLWNDNRELTPLDNIWLSGRDLNYRSGE